ncbi:sugar transferase [Epibacterium sp. SM1979]|uniref:Sugar transferase n=2 Tax=Tritonibacter litoralis TaxID=2662264 RepID=A0A843YJY5_9RHOB|nr:sugar transferase [Tritonibacter litoralis]
MPVRLVANALFHKLPKLFRKGIGSGRFTQGTSVKNGRNPAVENKVTEQAHFRAPTLYHSFGKRALDVTLVTLSAPIVVPMVLGLATIVARDGGKPFYSQTRVGRDGRHFTIWKMRTMVHEADKKLEAYLACNPAARAEWEEKQKLSKDPRITRFGHLLRKTSLDELPQFWNVFRGEMSLVGPRPMLPNQQGFYPGQDYYALRPGVTGSWQVSARNSSSFSDRARFDSGYAQGLSLLVDIWILAATVRVILKATGH